jgi:hypothetical protein
MYGPLFMKTASIKNYNPAICQLGFDEVSEIIVFQFHSMHVYK